MTPEELKSDELAMSFDVYIQSEHVDTLYKVVKKTDVWARRSSCKLLEQEMKRQYIECEKIRRYANLVNVYYTGDIVKQEK